MSKKVNQTTKVKEHLIEKRKITSFEAFRLYGCTRLSAKIFELRQRGWHIETNMVEKTTRYGDKTEIAEYILVSKGE